ncbi:MAG: RNA-binding domain-containing protein [Candidatus Poseidonia sp.]|nr:RNA-binding domain-containing protein [Poseidonia sp.]
MGLHRISWRATATALSNLDAIAEGLAWLVGNADDVELDRTASYHGPEVVLIDAGTANKKRALASLAQLGERNIQNLLESLEHRLDEQHVLHFRLELNALVDGEVVLADSSGTPTVKGQAKFEVYPGQPAADQILETIQRALKMAREKGRDGV